MIKSSWHYGRLYISLSAPTDSEAVAIHDIKPRILSADLPSPAWVFDPLSGCGSGYVYRTFEWNLDDASFEDTGVSTGEALDVAEGTIKEPLGELFVVEPGQFALMQVQTTSCQGNYEWTMDLVYQAAGAEQMTTTVLGPFRSYGVAGEAEVYTSNGEVNGKADLVPALEGSGMLDDRYC